MSRGRAAPEQQSATSEGILEALDIEADDLEAGG